VELWSAPGQKIRTLEGNASVTNWLTTHAYSRRRSSRSLRSDGVHIDAKHGKAGFPSIPNKRYPVIFDVYGGPGIAAGL